MSLDFEQVSAITILDSVRRLEKVVQAVPRLENFVSNIQKLLALEDEGQLALGHVMSRIN